MRGRTLSVSFEISLPLYIPGRYKQLREIIVYGNNRRQDSIANRIQYERIFNFDKGGLRTNNSGAESGFGAGLDLEALINVFRFRYNRSMARFQQRLIKEEQDRYIDYRFNKRIVKQLTILEDGPVLDAFMQEYRPDYELLTQALDILVAMREAEAANIVQDFLKRADIIEAMLQQVEKRSPATVQEYEGKLRERVERLLAENNAQLDPQLILQEVAVFADRTSITEECVRLHSHLKQLRQFLSGSGPVGRKLDFLVQEINREVNTIGSKCNDFELSAQVVDMKAEVEKIREQVQNIE